MDGLFGAPLENGARHLVGSSQSWKGRGGGEGEGFTVALYQSAVLHWYLTVLTIRNLTSQAEHMRNASINLLLHNTD